MRTSRRRMMFAASPTAVSKFLKHLDSLNKLFNFCASILNKFSACFNSLYGFLNTVHADITVFSENFVKDLLGISRGACQTPEISLERLCLSPCLLYYIYRPCQTHSWGTLVSLLVKACKAGFVNSCWSVESVGGRGVVRGECTVGGVEGTG